MRKKESGRVVVRARAFREARYPMLSLTLRSGELESHDQLLEYRQCFPLDSGDLQGICTVSYVDLTARVEPPLSPERAPIDGAYGQLHCETELPTEDQQNTLAKLATENGVLLDFVKSSDG